MKMIHIPLALALLTRLPLRLPNDWFNRSAQAHWAYPLVGVVLAVILSVIVGILNLLDLEPLITVILMLVASAMMTGAMHYDGLADTLDGFWGGYTQERRLEIMKDSQIGTYGVLGLIFAIALKVIALTVIFHNGDLIAALFVILPLSRAAMLVPMSRLPHARSSGLAHMSGRAKATSMHLAFAMSTVIALILFGWFGIFCAILAYGIGRGMSALAQIKINGQTGDVLGATQQISSIVICCALSIY